MPLIGRIASAAARGYGLFANIVQAVAVDPYFNYVVALLHGDGTNGGQNNTFLDSSSNNFTITRNGNTTQGSFSPFSQTGWSNYFNGSSTVSAAYNSAFQPNTYVSLECWVYFNSLASDQLIIGREGMWLNYSYTAIGATASKISFGIYNTSATWVAANSTTTPALNQWYHIVGIRDNTTLRIYINGVQEGTATFSGTPNTHTSAFAIGGSFTNTSNITGYVSNARYCNGATSNTLPYTGTSFTVPTSPLTVSTNTILLTCQSNRFVDNSGNAYAITANGSPSVQPFSPFNPTTAYSTGSIGGSGYFDGSGDYLNFTDSSNALDLGGAAASIELFFYPTAGGTQVILGKHGGSSSWSTSSGFEYQIQYTSNIFYFYYNSGGSPVSVTDSVSRPANQWYHIAVATDSSNNISFYINGTRVATSTSAITKPTTRTSFWLASDLNLNTTFGYVSNLRFISGANAYTASSSTLTVPTSPPTAVTGTQLLLSFTNGAIFDNAAVADYETVGNAQISTSVKKYGTGSMSFDGSGDYLKTNSPTADSFVFGTGDFTIEMWVYVNSLPGTDMVLYDGRPSNGAYPCIILQGSTNKFIWYVNTAAQITGSTPATSTWYHLAVCRVASQTKMFVNGTQVGSTYADTTNYLGSGTRPYIGANATNGLESFNGYIDDLRITKGVGRYQYNFTPPTAAFPNIGGTVTLTADPYYEYTTLLLPGNGTNGAQNNTFLDSSTNAFTITRNGNTTQGTFSPFSQTGWGNYFDGSDDYLSLADNAAFNYGSGDFTIEFWVYFNSTANQAILFKRSSVLADAYASVDISTTAASKMSYEFANSAGNGWAAQLTGAVTVTVGQWYHIAVVRNGTAASCYVNGTLDASTTLSSSIFNNSQTVTIGYDKYNGNDLSGYLSNLRIVKGTAVYTANFTPPTSPLTAITNTSLLTCQSNRFIDNSTNNFAITVNGTVTVQAFSPFNPTASWSAATYGGSGYFDGSGDYLTLPTAAESDLNLTGTFTFECWFYCSTSGDMWFFSKGGGTNDWNSTNGIAYQFMIESGSVKAQFNTGGSFLTISATAPASASWNHFAIGRNGTTLRAWLNGASMGTSTTSISPPTTRNIIKVGANTVNGSTMNGYLAGMIAVNGTDVYGVGNTTITVPTAPPTAITNTKFLANFTNAGIYDATSKNDLETVGNAQISTTQSKFGGSSMYFDGNGDYLYVAPAQNLPFLFGSGDFTVEGWIYPSGVSGTQYIASVWGIVGQSDTTFSSWVLRTNAANLEIVLQSGATTTVITGSGSGLATNTWQHVAVTRYGNTVKLFINGAQVVSSSYSSTLNSPASAFVVGLQLSNNNTFTGYIDDLRITKGIARYTSNFTPPTTAFLTL